MSIDESLREHLRKLLLGRQAHRQFEEILSGVPFAQQGIRPPGAQHSPWEVLEHLRISQWDILEFSRNPEYVAPKFPEGYWPDSMEPPDPDAWRRSMDRFQTDLKEMVELVGDPARDLTARIPHGQGQTLLREALLVADHNAYHLGEMVLLRRVLGCWEEPTRPLEA